MLQQRKVTFTRISLTLFVQKTEKSGGWRQPPQRNTSAASLISGWCPAASQAAAGCSASLQPRLILRALNLKITPLKRGCLCVEAGALVGPYSRVNAVPSCVCSSPLHSAANCYYYSPHQTSCGSY